MSKSPEEITVAIITRFDALNAVRDRALGDGRTIIRLSANSVRAIHRGQIDDATAQLQLAEAQVRELRDLTLPFGSIYWAGYVQDALKEFAEASITLAIVKGESIPEPGLLGVEDPAFLNAMAEAASELRRLILDALRGEEISRAERYLAQMDDIYGVLVTVDFPDAITGGLRRTTDQLRAVLERTRGDVTLTLNQRRLERVLIRAQQEKER